MIMYIELQTYDERRIAKYTSDYETSAELALAEGVDSFIKINQSEILIAIYFNTFDDPNEYQPYCFQWCYIPVGTKISKLLQRDCENIPKKKFFGKNLVFENFEMYPIEDDVYALLNELEEYGKQS